MIFPILPIQPKSHLIFLHSYLFIPSFFQGFIPRGEQTLTSRLFVLEKLKQELDRQLAAARIINKNKISSSINNKLPLSVNNAYDDDDDDDYLSEEDLTPQNFLEDFTNNLDECAFPSSRQTRCLTNQQVFRLMNNRSDLLKTSRIIEQNLFKPNEQMCTSIDLSKTNAIIDKYRKSFVCSRSKL